MINHRFSSDNVIGFKYCKGSHLERNKFLHHVLVAEYSITRQWASFDGD